jgi:citrate lyase subunit beta / citryl-CoA lyase
VRSLLFVPAHDARKLAKALDCGADALIIDLEDSVPDTEKSRARAMCVEFVRENRERLPLFVRVNASATGLMLDDLAAVVRAQPYGIALPKCGGGRDVARLDACLSALEAREGILVGLVRILPIVTEFAGALFEMPSYAHEAGPRLCGMMWGGEDLATDIGASANRVEGLYTPPFQLARSLCLFGAAAAGVPAVDAVYTDFHVTAQVPPLACPGTRPKRGLQANWRWKKMLFRLQVVRRPHFCGVPGQLHFHNLDGLRAEAHTAVASGFAAKALIHPGQVQSINEVFTPSDEALREATIIVEAFAQHPGAGAVNIGGRMFDRPHLSAAQRLIARAGLGIS